MKSKILFALSLPKLKTSALNHTDLAIFLTRLEDKEIAEKIEMGADAKDNFIEVDEGSNVKNRIGIQMDQLDPVLVEKTMKESTGQQTNPP